jgi:hypothetical protein
LNSRLIAEGLVLEALALVPLPLSLSSKLAWDASVLIDGILVSAGLVLAVSGLFAGTRMTVRAAGRLAVASFILGVVFLFAIIESYIAYSEALNACVGQSALNYQGLTRCDQAPGLLYYTGFSSTGILVSTLIFLRSVFFLNGNPQAHT